MIATALKTLRHFPADAFIICMIAVGILSLTSHVELFRLGIPSLYEHIIAYFLLGLIMVAARGKAEIGISDVIMITILAAMCEAVKAEVPFRHPKVSDYYADLIGLGLSIITIGVLRTIGRITISIRKKAAY